MKKLFLLLCSAAIFSSSYAQLPPNSIAPDFTLRDINGNTHHLYDYLDRGYTVFLDFSAAWCGPCWTYHGTHALRDVYENHGPAGASGVLSGTTDDAMVFYIEGETTNTTAQLRGSSSGSARSTFSQGDWVTGTTYPIIDTGSYCNTLNAAYNIGYFPTIYKVCPDRIINEIGAQTAAVLYAAVPTCTRATTSNDPSMVQYTGQSLTYCGSLDVKAILQNHGTAPLTSATIQVLQGSTVLTSYNWTGSLATYAFADVTIGTVTVSGSAPVTVKISTTNDDLTNDQIGVSYTALSSAAAPSDITMETAADPFTPPTGMYIVDKDIVPSVFPNFAKASDFSSPPPVRLGGYGASDKSMLWLWYNYISGYPGSVVLDRVVIPTLTAGDQVLVQLDYAYAQRWTTDNVRLEVNYSKNCGTTWLSAFDKTGNLLATRDTVPVSIAFFPTSAEWKTGVTDITSNVASGDEVILKIRGTSGGNNLFADNVKIYLKNTTGVKELVSDATINVYPNPSSDVLNISFSADQSETVNIKLIDMQGKVVFESSETYGAGAQTTSLNVKDIPAGAYSMTLATDKKVVAKNVSITH